VDKVLSLYGDELKIYLDKQIDQFKRLKRVDSEEMLESELFHITINEDDNNGVLELSSKMRSELDYTPSTVCGMHQSDKLVVDISGNIRSCQNVGTDVFNGNILDFNEQNNIMKLKGIQPNKHQDRCHECPVFLLCLSGCPLDFNQEFFDINCKVSMTHNTTMLHSAFKMLFGSDVEWLGTSI
jgi:radical SAM protein with 4Fe4S-binding SPASM domain